MPKRPSGKHDKDKSPEGDPYRGDKILRRMLKTKPTPHKEMVKGGRDRPHRSPRA